MKLENNSGGELDDGSLKVLKFIHTFDPADEKEKKRMAVYFMISIVSGILFAILDGVINANPLAKKYYAIYQPIAKTSLNPVAGLLIDLLFGFIMAGIFVLLYNSLPGETGLVKGVSFAIMVWFFRVVMYVASQWMMFITPVKTLIYTLVAGLGEMLVLGVLYGFTLKPF